MNPELEGDEVEELTKEIRRLIESNKQFLERVNDEEFEDDDETDSEAGPDPEAEAEDYEEL